MDKTGSATQFTIEMVLKFLGLTLTGLIAMQLVISMYGETQLQTDEVRREVFFQRILTSPQGPAAVQGDRVTAGVINMSKFDTEHIAEPMQYPSDLILAGNVSLKTMDGAVKSSVAYNKPRYKAWRPQALASLSGSGAIELERRVVPVTVEAEGEKERMLLVMEALTQ